MEESQRRRQEIKWALRHLHLILFGMAAMIYIGPIKWLGWKIADLIAAGIVLVLGHDAELG